jgi:hypothetical protein
MRDRNVMHVRERADGLYDIEIFPLGTYTTTKEGELTAEKVAERILSGPKTTTILSMDAAGDPVDYHDPIRAELRKQGKDFISEAPCATCGETGNVGGADCPDCRVPWK